MGRNIRALSLTDDDLLVISNFGYFHVRLEEGQREYAIEPGAQMKISRQIVHKYCTY
jgi:hypothetical protein